jgi:hypothetical protein
MKSASPLIGLLLLVLGLAPLAAESVLAQAASPTTATAQASALQFDFAVKLDERPLAKATLHGDPLCGSRYDGAVRLDVPGQDTWQIAVKLYTTEYDRKSLLRIDIYDADRLSSNYCETVVPLFSTVLVYRGSGVYQLFALNGTGVSVTVRDDVFTRPFMVRTRRTASPPKPAKLSP